MLQDDQKSFSSSCRREAGFSLIEASIYVGLLAILAGPLVTVMIVSSNSTAEAAALSSALERNRVVAFRVAETLRTAISDTVVVGAGGQSVTFTLPDSYDGTNIVPGDTIQLAFQLVDDEDNNDLDDNGNGLIDEGQLVQTDVITGEVVQLGGDLDMDVCQFLWDGSSMSVTCASSYDRAEGYTYEIENEVISRTWTITPRN